MRIKKWVLNYTKFLRKKVKFFSNLNTHKLVCCNISIINSLKNLYTHNNLYIFWLLTKLFHNFFPYISLRKDLKHINELIGTRNLWLCQKNVSRVFYAKITSRCQLSFGIGFLVQHIRTCTFTAPGSRMHIAYSCSLQRWSYLYLYTWTACTHTHSRTGVLGKQTQRREYASQRLRRYWCDYRERERSV